MTRILERKEQLAEWLSQMPVPLDRFLEQLPGEVRRKLDFSLESLDILEEWLLQRYSDYHSLIQPTERAIWDGAARYIGEIYRKQLGAYWQARFEPPNYVYRGFPELTGYNPPPTPEAPHVLATTLLDRRTGIYLRDLLRKMKERSLELCAQQETPAKRFSSQDLQRTSPELPILGISPSAGQDALLKYEMTAAEVEISNEMDRLTAALPVGTDLDEYHRIVAEIGRKYGLEDCDSVAF